MLTSFFWAPSRYASLTTTLCACNRVYQRLSHSSRSHSCIMKSAVAGDFNVKSVLQNSSNSSSSVVMELLTFSHPRQWLQTRILCLHVHRWLKVQSAAQRSASIIHCSKPRCRSSNQQRRFSHRPAASHLHISHYYLTFLLSDLISNSTVSRNLNSEIELGTRTRGSEI